MIVGLESLGFCNVLLKVLQNLGFWVQGFRDLGGLGFRET